MYIDKAIFGKAVGGYGNFEAIGTLDIYIKQGGMIYGADIYSQEDHWLAITVYTHLVAGNEYLGINQFAAIHTPVIPPGIPLPDIPFPDSAFTDTFNLSRLDAVDLQGRYTIDWDPSINVPVIPI